MIESINIAHTTDESPDLPTRSNTHPLTDAKAAFVRVADAYEQLRDPAGQLQTLAALSRKPSSHHKPAAAPSSGLSRAAAAGARKRPRSFMDILREWEEFEREWLEKEQAHKTAEQQHRAEKKVRVQGRERDGREGKVGFGWWL